MQSCFPGPKTVKLFANREHMGFSNVNDFPPSDTAVLSSDTLEGKPVILKYVKFQNVRSLTIFVEDNQSGSDITKVQKIVLYGTTVETTDMKGLKKIEDH
ncbi:PITH domain-containing protein At3g04780 [Camellia sinensis]|uniref:PITH domain-containing protein At3g04780 n=1 Tax=Camellia sinensis TaxID=4442 RepID=UPI0010365A80|nr:PITH domain-containing protein At3g04780 [Camellia sinensis]